MSEFEEDRVPDGGDAHEHNTRADRVGQAEPQPAAEDDIEFGDEASAELS